MGRITRYIIASFLLLHAFCAAELDLPYYMQELRDYELHQMVSCKQEGPSCGWYATLNAYAIQELHKQNIPLTDENIQAHVKDVGIPFVRSREQELSRTFGRPILQGMNAPEQEQLAMRLGLTDYYIVHIEESGVTWCFCRGMWKSYARVEQFLREIRLHQAPRVHLLLAVPMSSYQYLLPGSSYQPDYHAVLISRIKRRAPKPFLLYMDSNNVSLDPWSVHFTRPSFFSDYSLSKNAGDAEYHQICSHVCQLIRTLDTL